MRNPKRQVPNSEPSRISEAKYPRKALQDGMGVVSAMSSAYLLASDVDGGVACLINCQEVSQGSNPVRQSLRRSHASGATTFPSTSILAGKSNPFNLAFAACMYDVCLRGSLDLPLVSTQRDFEG